MLNLTEGAAEEEEEGAAGVAWEEAESMAWELAVVLAVGSEVQEDEDIRPRW